MPPVSGSAMNQSDPDLPGRRQRPHDTGPSVVRMAVAEPREIVRFGLAAALGVHDDLSLEVTADIGGLRRLLATDEMDLVVVDLALGELDQLGLPSDHGPDEECPVIVLATRVNDAQMLDVFRQGARGLVLVDTAPSVLPIAVWAVAAGGIFIDPGLAGTLVTIACKGQPGSHGAFNLTVQQQRVLARLPDGLTNREIGEELGISPNTVKAHLRKAMAKIGAHDRIDAGEIVVREGLV